MIGLGSIKQSERVKAEVTSTLTPVPIFKDGITTATAGSGVSADPEAGKLVLAPGTYLLLLTIQVTWTHAPSIEIAVVVGDDPRFKGPRVLMEHENGALALAASLPPRQVEWDRTAAGTATAFGVVTVPPGDPAACNVYAEAETRHSTRITFAAGELVAILLAHNPTEADS